MVRAPSIDENGMKKGAWSKEEDHKLRAYVLRYGHWNWRLVPRYAGLNRCGKSCRLRWMNYLKPGVKRGNFTRGEGELVQKLHDQLGNKWSAIAAQLPGRTDNEIKNYWHTHFHKRDRSRSTNSKQTGHLLTKFSQEQRCSETASSGIDNSPNSVEILQSFAKQEALEVSSSDVYILESSNSGVSDNWDLDSFVEQICSEMQPEPSDSLDFNWDDGASSSADSFSGLIQESFMVDTSYIQEFDFPLFEDCGIYYSQSLGFDDNDIKLF